MAYKRKMTLNISPMSKVCQIKITEFEHYYFYLITHPVDIFKKAWLKHNNCLFPKYSFQVLVSHFEKNNFEN